MRALRKALPPGRLRGPVGTDRWQRLAELEPLARARSVCLFWPIEDRHEVDLRPLDATPARARRSRGLSGHRPGDGGDDVPLRVGSGRDGGAGLRLPRAVASRARSAAGRDRRDRRPGARAGPPGPPHRLRRGLLRPRSCRATRRPRSRVAVAFDFQLVAEVPESAVDVRVGWIVTDASVARVAEVRRRNASASRIEAQPTALIWRPWRVLWRSDGALSRSSRCGA